MTDNTIYNSKKMPDELRRQVELLTPLQRKYCEYRATGLRQHEAASKAGSNASTKDSLGRVGYNIEQEAGAKDYINWLMEVRAHQACVDDVEIIEKLRKTYDEAMTAGKFSDANRAAQLLGELAGLFSKNRIVAEAEGKQQATKNNVDAFKEGGEDPEERLKRLRSFLKDT